MPTIDAHEVEVDVTIQRRVDGPWYSVDITVMDMLNILKTGEFDNEKLTAIKVCQINYGEEDKKVDIIYDFVNLNTDKNPWRLI